MTLYVARAEGWIAGRRVAAGAVVELTEAQAKYEPVDPAPAPAAAATRPGRAPRQSAAAEAEAPE